MFNPIIPKLCSNRKYTLQRVFTQRNEFFFDGLSMLENKQKSVIRNSYFLVSPNRQTQTNRTEILYHNCLYRATSTARKQEKNDLRKIRLEQNLTVPIVIVVRI